MSTDIWAKREVELAKNEALKSGSDNCSAHYICECLNSALKAFNSLIEDGHSGASVEQTLMFLQRLVRGLPLTPIDEDTIWVKSAISESGTVTYQCARMTGLFKDVDKEGKITYSDVHRVVCVNKDDLKAPVWYNGFVSKIVNSIYPIKFPYYTSSDPIIAYVCEHTTSVTEDFDTMCVDSVKLNNGETVELKRFFKEDTDSNSWVEIDEEEYNRRVEIEKTLNK